MLHGLRTPLGGVYGGGYTINGDANNNTVTISGGTVEQAKGGRILENGDATNNTAIMSGGTVEKWLVGGQTKNGNATGNTVTISGGTMNGNEIIGGQTENGNAINNTVTISGNPIFGPDTRIWGGNSASGGIITGNTLNWRTFGPKVAGVHDFQNLNFFLPSGIVNNAIMISVTTYEVNLLGVNVDLSFDSTTPSLEIGNVITLIDNVNGTMADKTVVVGAYTFKISISNEKKIRFV